MTAPGLVPAPKVTRSDLYHSGRQYAPEYPGQPSSQNIYALRSTQQYRAVIALGAMGYTDMSIEITHNFSVGGTPLGMRVWLNAAMDMSAVPALGMSSVALSPDLLEGQYGEYIGPGGRYWFVPEVGPYINQQPAQTPPRFIREVPELRGPFALIALTVQTCAASDSDPRAATAADAGELAFRLVRRS